MVDFLIGFALFFIPRFLTDRVALAVDDNGEWFVYCLEGQELEGDDIMIQEYGTIETFTWLGFTRGGMVLVDE